jgi:MFS transporter, CP family, cyanate transporter
MAARPIRVVTALLLLWLAGNALRVTILAVPPVIPLIHLDLHMSQTQVGILSGIPMVLFAGAAIAGSLLVARFGAVWTLIAGLVLCAAGGALRGVGPNIWMLYAMTVVTAFGVAVMQPSMPALVRAWVPKRIGFATAVYTNGLIAGEIFPVAFTIPWLLPMIGNSWPLSFAFWSAPVAIIAVVVMIFAPRRMRLPADAPSVPVRWWPNWRDPQLWRIGLILGSINALYFSNNAFLPDHLNRLGRPDLISPALTALNLGQLPASFLLLVSAEWLVRKWWAYAICGFACFVCIIGIVFGDAFTILVSNAVIGFFGAVTLVLILALTPIISAPGDVARTASGIFTISYSCAVAVPIISGIAWDMTGRSGAAFVPIAICALAVVALAPFIRVGDKSPANT